MVKWQMTNDWGGEGCFDEMMGTGHNDIWGIHKTWQQWNQERGRRLLNEVPRSAFSPEGFSEGGKGMMRWAFVLFAYLGVNWEHCFASNIFPSKKMRAPWTSLISIQGWGQAGRKLPPPWQGTQRWGQACSLKTDLGWTLKEEIFLALEIFRLSQLCQQMFNSVFLRLERKNFLFVRY